MPNTYQYTPPAYEFKNGNYYYRNTDKPFPTGGDWSWGGALKGAIAGAMTGNPYLAGAGAFTGGVTGDTKGGWGPEGNPNNPLPGQGGGSRDPYSQINALGQKTEDFSNQQWNRQMQGLNQGRAAMDPSAAWWQATYGNRGPGSMENAFRDYSSQYFNPQATTGAYNDYQKYLGKDPLSYTYSNQASALGGGKVDYSGIYNQLNGPGAGQNFYSQNQGAYNRGGSLEDWYRQNQPTLNRTTNASNVYDLYSGQLTGPSNSENFRVNAPDFTDARNARNRATGFADQAQAQTRLEGAQGAEVGGRLRGADDVTRFAQRSLPGLGNQGLYEQFVQSDIMGFNPAKQRNMDEGLAAINQEMARRGHFKSGGADTAIGNFLGKLEAEDYQNRAQRAQTAQGMELARLGEGRQMAQAASGEKLGVAGALQGLGSEQDAQRLSRQQFGADTFLKSGQQALDQERVGLEGQRLSLDAAGQADAERRARLGALQGMAGESDRSIRDQSRLGFDAAREAQDATFRRLDAGMGAAGQAEKEYFDRLNQQYTMQGRENDQNLDRGKFTFDMGQSLDKLNMDRHRLQGDLANMSDTQRRAALDAFFNQAGKAQDAESLRFKDSMDQLFNINKQQSDLYRQFYGDAGQLSGQPFSDAINAYANAIGIRAQGNMAAQARRDQATGDWLKLMLEGYKTYKMGKDEEE